MATMGRLTPGGGAPARGTSIPNDRISAARAKAASPPRVADNPVDERVSPSAIRTKPCKTQTALRRMDCGRSRLSQGRNLARRQEDVIGPPRSPRPRGPLYPGRRQQWRAGSKAAHRSRHRSARRSARRDSGAARGKPSIPSRPERDQSGSKEEPVRPVAPIGEEGYDAPPAGRSAGS